MDAEQRRLLPVDELQLLVDNLPGLNTSERKLLMAIAHLGDRLVCDASLAELADVMDVSRKTAQRAAIVCRRYGVLAIAERSGRPNEYSIDVAALIDHPDLPSDLVDYRATTKTRFVFGRRDRRPADALGQKLLFEDDDRSVSEPSFGVVARALAAIAGCLRWRPTRVTGPADPGHPGHRPGSPAAPTQDTQVIDGADPGHFDDRTRVTQDIDPGHPGHEPGSPGSKTQDTRVIDPGHPPPIETMVGLNGNQNTKPQTKPPPIAMEEDDGVSNEFRGGFGRELTDADLKPPKIAETFRLVASKPWWDLDETPRDRHEFVGLALYCLDKGAPPPALLKWLLDKGRDVWAQRIRGGDEDEVRRIVSELDRRAPLRTAIDAASMLPAIAGGHCAMSDAERQSQLDRLQAMAAQSNSGESQ